MPWMSNRRCPSHPWWAMTGSLPGGWPAPSPGISGLHAREIQNLCRSRADFIWVDDDCRFTHLGTVEYPCFCPRCVAGFEGGRFSSREALVDALNRPENTALRHKWSEYGADRLAKYCQTAREAVEEVDPNIPVSLMTVGYSHTTYAGDYI